MAYQIQVRSDIAANWLDRNPILSQGEPGYETDTGKIKYGDGVTAWTALAYFTAAANISPGGANGQIQFNSNGSFAGSSDFTVAGNSLSVVGTVSAASVTAGVISATSLSGNGAAIDLTHFAGNIIPAANMVYSLGSNTRQWKELHVSGNTIYLGNSALSIGPTADLTFNGSPVVTTSNTGNSVINGSINVSGAIVSSNVVASQTITGNSITSNAVTVTGPVQALSFSGDGSRLTGIAYSNITGAYSNANVAAFLPVYTGAVRGANVSVTGNVTGQYFIGNGAFLTGISASSNYSNANVAAYLPTDPTIVALSSDVANLEATAYSNANVANYLPTDATIVAIESNIANLQTSSYSNANVANYLPVYNGNIASDTVTAESLFVGNATLPGAYFISATGSGVSMGETAAQYVAVLSSGIDIAGTGGVTVQGINGASVHLGGSTSGAIQVYSPINLGFLSNIGIAGGNAGQVLSTDGTAGLSWIDVAGNYSNANVVAFLPTYGGDISADSLYASAVSATGNITGQYFIGNGAFLTGLDMAEGYSNANVANFMPVYSGDVLADVVTANTITANSVTTAYDMVTVQTTANTIILGNASTAVNQTSWLTAESSTLSNVTLFSINASNISSIDFGITATSGNNRQVSKILAVTLGNNFNYTEYGSLGMGSLLGNFFVDVIAGNLVLQVAPFTANNVYYSVILDYDYDLHLGSSGGSGGGSSAF